MQRDKYSRAILMQSPAKLGNFHGIQRNRFLQVSKWGVYLVKGFFVILKSRKSNVDNGK